LNGRTRLLIHGPEVGREHPARLGALRRGIRQETPAGWLREQMQGRIGVAVAGGREASVAAAMTGFILVRAGLDPSLLLGAASPQLGGWSREGSGPHVVAEWSGEIEGFGVFRPRVAVLLNVGGEPRTDRDLRAEALRRVLRALPPDGHVLALGHPALLGSDPGSDGVPVRFEWVSLRRGGDWWGTDLREESGRFRFRVFHRGRYVIEVRLQVRGRRGVVAALAAAAVCRRLGVPASSVRQGLEEFSGLARDFEARGSFRGVTLVDDEAVDAASVRDALAMARRVFGGRRLWAVSAAPGPAPGEARRLVAALSAADRVLVTEGGPDAGGLTRALADAGVWARRAADVVGAISELDRHLEPGDVLLTLGAGDVGTIADAFIRRLPRDRQGE
jgi:UDP-N-acetylmuramate--alanine ligase